MTVGCVSCHGDLVVMMLAGIARDRSFSTDLEDLFYAYKSMCIGHLAAGAPVSNTDTDDKTTSICTTRLVTIVTDRIRSMGEGHVFLTAGGGYPARSRAGGPWAGPRGVPQPGPDRAARSHAWGTLGRS